MTMIKNNVAVLIGRFQTYRLHEGYIEILRYCKQNYTSTLILIGVAPWPSKENPLSYQERADMFYDRGVVTLPLQDFSSDEKWSTAVDTTINLVFPNQKADLLYSRKSMLPHCYCGKHTLKQLESYNDGISSSQMREKTKCFSLDSEELRFGVIKGLMNEYDQTLLTVDVAPVRVNIDAQPEILLAKRHKDDTHYRFIGGFVDIKDETTEQAARREALEEANVMVEDLEYIGSYRPPDWRNTPSKKILTVFYLGYICHMNGPAIARDDIAEVKWFLKEDLNEDMFVKEHQELYIKFVQHMNKEKGEVRYVVTTINQ